MPKKKPSEVDVWLGRETPRVRKALENASRHLDPQSGLTVHTLEAMYARESSFGVLVGERGSTRPAGHFQLKANVAKHYGLSVSKKNDQRFNIDFASSAAAQYLRDQYSKFSTRTVLSKDRITIPIKDASERKKFAFGAYNAGEGRIAEAQRLTREAGKDPQSWDQVQKFLELAGSSKTEAAQARQYVEEVPTYQIEFMQKSLAGKNSKGKTAKKGEYRCIDGHWVTIDDRHVLICDSKDSDSKSG